MSNALKLAACGSNTPRSLYQIISDAGLTSGLKLCLDAGDSASYDPAVQTEKWLDTSGGGYDFYRGSSTAGDAAEPTFNGSAGGLSSAEYFSFDGGGYFRYDTTTETWMANLSRAGAKLTYLLVLAPFSAAAQIGIVTTLSGATRNGSQFVISSGGTIQLRAANASTNSTEISGTGLPLTLGGSEWSILQLSFDEADSTSGAIVSVNNALYITSGGYTTPSTTGESPMALGANATSVVGGFFPAGSKMACVAIWEGVALSQDNLSTLYNAVNARFNVIPKISTASTTKIAESATDAASYSFSAINVNGAGLIVIAVSAQATGAQSLTSLTINGVTATKASGTVVGTDSTVCEIWYGETTTGTSVDVVVNFSGAMLRCGIAVRRVVNITSAVPHKTATVSDAGSAATGLSATLTSCDANAVVFGAYTNSTGSITTAWTGVTELYDQNIAAEATSYSGGLTKTTVSGDHVVSTSHTSGTSNLVLAVAAWV